MTEILPVTADDLKEVLTSDEFKEHVDEVLGSLRKGRLAGSFVVVRDVGDGSIHFSNVFSGPVCLTDKYHVPDYGSLRNPQIYTVLNLSIKDTLFPPVIPDGPSGEFDALSARRHTTWLNSRPIGMMGRLGRRVDRLETLILQEKTEQPLSAEQIYEHWIRIVSDPVPVITEFVAEEFKRTGVYNAATILFRLNDGAFQAEPEQLAKLEEFAYQPLET